MRGNGIALAGLGSEVSGQFVASFHPSLKSDYMLLRISELRTLES